VQGPNYIFKVQCINAPRCSFASRAVASRPAALLNHACFVVASCRVAPFPRIRPRRCIVPHACGAPLWCITSGRAVGLHPAAIFHRALPSVAWHTTAASKASESRKPHNTCKAAPRRCIASRRGVAWSRAASLSIG